MRMSLADIIMISFFLIAGFITRFYRFHLPDSRGFDEIFFGKFVSYYIQEKFFFDIHPPFSKLLLYLNAYLGEYDGSIDFTSNQIKYNSSDYIHLRILPCIISALTPATVFYASRLLLIPTVPSFLAGSHILFDTMNIAEGKLILTDTTLSFLVVLSIVFSEKAALTNSLPYFFLFSTPLSLALATKFTSGGAFIYSIAVLFKKRIDLKWFFKRSFLLVAYIFIIIFILICVHLSSFTYESEDIIFDSPELFGCLYKQGESKNITQCEKQYGITLRSFYTLFSMLFYGSNSNINDQSSHPYQWPLCLNNWMHFSSDPNINFYGFAQPLSWPITFFLTVIMTFICFFKKCFDPLIIGYWFSYLPFFIIRRAVYTYHYMIPSIFASLISSKLLSYFPAFYSNYISVILSFFVMCGFIVYRNYCYCI